MSEEYQPELGQAVFGNRWGSYEVPPFAVALLSSLVRDDFSRVFGNTHSRIDEPFDEYAPMRCGDVYYRPYCWSDCICTEGEVGPQCDSCKPNFGIDGDSVEIRWYKHLRRGVSVNVPLTVDEWVQWFDRVSTALDQADTRFPGGKE